MKAASSALSWAWRNSAISALASLQLVLFCGLENPSAMRSTAAAVRSRSAQTAVRLYVASGEAADRDKFEKPLATFRAALASVGTQADLLTERQATAYRAIARANEAFTPLPQKIFAIRRTPQWNAPVFILSTEAAPRAARILDLLDGRKDADGKRSGGLKSDQQSKLAEDARSVADAVERLLLLQWILLAAGLALGTTIAILVARSITRPIVELVGDSARLSGGDTSVEFKTAGRGDEIGVVSQAVAKFRDNVIAQQQAAASLAREAEAREAANRNMEDAVEEFRGTSRDLLALVGENAGTMRQTAESLGGIANHATSQAASAATASEQTAVNVQTVAAAAEQLASSIVEIGRQIELSNKTVRSAGEVTARSEAEIEGLAHAAQSISSRRDVRDGGDGVDHGRGEQNADQRKAAEQPGPNSGVRNRFEHGRSRAGGRLIDWRGGTPECEQ